MTNNIFGEIVEDQLRLCKEVLGVKATEYSGEGDRLHNFKVAAVVQECSPRRALAGMMVKHTVSIYDMCVAQKNYCQDMWDEKITDHINYLLLLKAVIAEEIRDNFEL